MGARLLCGALLTALLAGCGSGPPQAQVTVASPSARSAPTTSPPTPTPADMRVYVAGAVERPGVYALSPDSRVEDAISAAGGFRQDADQPRVNLAARVHDEEEIFVPRVGEPALPPAPAAVDINTASAAKLRDGLHISSTLASRIVAYRRQHGPFKTVDDLRLVPVPPDQLNRIRALATAS